MKNAENVICDALLDLIEEQPLRTIKVTKLADRAGISRSTFYLYFDSIESVVERIEDEYFEFGPSTELPAPYSLDEAQWKRYFSKMSRVLRVYGALAGPNGDPGFVAKLEERDRTSLKSSSAPRFKGEHAAEFEVVHEFVHGGKMRAARWWAAHPDDISVNDFSSIMFKLIRACTRATRG